MGYVTPKFIYARDEKGNETDQHVASIHDASQESVYLVLAADPHDEWDGRSQWMWVRLQNGDLILGVFPQGDTYFSVEEDASTPTHLT